MSASAPRPSFFIVGNSKSGTTALSDFLRQHPQLFVCVPNEPNYFAKDFQRDPNPGALFHPLPEADYLALFREAGPGVRCGEASACYLYSDVAIAGIRAFDPAAQLIVILREPVSFLRSYHLQQLKNPITEGESEQDFATALALEPARKRGEQRPPGNVIPEFLYYRERVKYADHLRRAYASFPKEQVLVLLYEAFLRDNAATYREVLTFLGVDPTFQPQFAQYNTGGKVVTSRERAGLLQRITHGQGPFGVLKPLVKALLPSKARKKLVKRAYASLVLQEAEPVDPALRQSLMRTFKPEVEAVSALLGRDLVTFWGYDQV